MNIQGTWLVVNKDGTYHSELNEDGSVNKMREINWEHAETVVFDSQWFRTTIDVRECPEGHRFSIRRRHVLNVVDEEDTHDIGILMLVTSQQGKPVGDDTVKQVIYWVPHGIEHVCPHFNCGEISGIAQALLRGKREGIMPIHGTCKVRADAVLTEGVKL